MKTLINQKLVMASFVLLTWAASNALADNTKTLASGYIIHTSPFGAIEMHSGMRWIDNQRLASRIVDRSQAGSPQSGFRVWNVDSDEVIDVMDRDLECVASGNPEPVLLTRGLKEIGQKEFPEVRLTLKVFPRYLGPLGREERIPEEDGPPWTPPRKQRLKSGLEILQTNGTDNAPFFGCRSYWWPNDDTPAQIVEIMKNLTHGQNKVVAAFGDRMFLLPAQGASKGQPATPAKAFLPDRKEPIVYPDSACFGGWLQPNQYYAFKNAYLAAGANAKALNSDYEATEAGCIIGSYWGRPFTYGWLHADGRLEYGVLPPVSTLLPEKEQEIIKTRTNAARGGTFIPTAAGFIYASGLLGSIKDRLYLFKDDRYVEIYRGDHLASFTVSPDGCRLALERQGIYARASEDSPLKVIDLCHPGQSNQTSTK